MAKIWDESMRKLVRASPQAFVHLIIPEGVFIKERSDKLRNWKLEPDALLDVQVNGKAMLLHLEFQTHNDPSMPERLLRYNVLTRS